ncbi:MAG TPA: tetratricopeptide repeat protein [Candidatus Margulisiibacteriota bacterium]|nr:tetratricopeptide repeat protein [Candidatus Margulisiibacteriota bacterium]
MTQESTATALQITAQAAQPDKLEFTIGADEFDVSLLPPDGRMRGTAAFRDAVREYLRREFQPFGGWTTVVVDDWNVQVTWVPDGASRDPLEQVIRRLRQGEYGPAVTLLRLFLSDRPNDVSLLYNLGTALSDMGLLDEAERYLRRVVELAPAMTNACIALGSTLQQNGKTDEAIQVLRESVRRDPANPWAQRTLGTCLLASGRIAEAHVSLQRTTELNPRDLQAWFALAQSLQRQGRLADAYRAYRKVVDIDTYGQLAELARDALRAIIQRTAPAVERPDAVMYCLDAIERFEKILRSQVRRIALEVAMLGRKGLDVNGTAQRYRLKSLPGGFCGLHLTCLMYVGFKIVAPEKDIGFDLSKEYAAARTIHAKRG